MAFKEITDLSSGSSPEIKSEKTVAKSKTKMRCQKCNEVEMEIIEPNDKDLDLPENTHSYFNKNGEHIATSWTDQNSVFVYCNNCGFHGYMLKEGVDTSIESRKRVESRKPVYEIKSMEMDEFKKKVFVGSVIFSVVFTFISVILGTIIARIMFAILF